MKSIPFPCLPLLAFMAFTGWVQHSPDYTETLTGVYTMTYMNWNGDIARMPEPGFSGSVRMTKRDNTHLDMTFSIKAHGNGKTIDETSDPQTVELRPGHGMSFFLYENRVKLGTISPKAISIKTVTETGAGVVEIKAWR